MLAADRSAQGQDRTPPATRRSVCRRLSELRHYEQQWNAPHLAPRRFKCSVVDDDHAALEHLPDIVSPAAARRRALAVILDEHHREPVTPDDTAHSACDNRCDRTTHRHTNCPPGRDPGLSAPERNARQPSVATSSQAVGHRRFAAGHLDKRPHVLCVKRVAGIVALSPFHETAAPFAAAAIPPHSLKPAHTPPPAAPRGILQSI